MHESMPVTNQDLELKNQHHSRATIGQRLLAVTGLLAGGTFLGAVLAPSAEAATGYSVAFTSTAANGGEIDAAVSRTSYDTSVSVFYSENSPNSPYVDATDQYIGSMDPNVVNFDFASQGLTCQTSTETIYIGTNGSQDYASSSAIEIGTFTANPCDGTSSTTSSPTTSSPTTSSPTTSTSPSSQPASAPYTPAMNTPGYWMTAADGGIFAQSGAPFEGSIGGTVLNQPVVGMAEDTKTGGYWEVARDGGVFNYYAPFEGSAGALHLNKPVVGMAATPTGEGYYLVASDGGVFTYGDARFQGSTGNLNLTQPIVGMAEDAATGGYWLVAADGGVFSYDAPFYGSTGNIKLAQPIVDMISSPDGRGYDLIAKDGGVFSFGDAKYYGNTYTDGASVTNIVDGASLSSGGYVEISSDGHAYPFSSFGAGTPYYLNKNLVAPIVGGAGYFSPLG